RAGALQQEAELHVFVARHARNRSAAAEVLRDERRDDALLEQLFDVGDVERNAQRVGDRARVVDVFGAAAAAALVLGLVAPHAQGDAEHFVALLLQQSGGRR